jgi:hypothetical protein
LEIRKCKIPRKPEPTEFRERPTSQQLTAQN